MSLLKEPPHEQHQKATIFARWVYASVIVVFVSVCTVAVVLTLLNTQGLQGFHGIKVIQANP